MKTTNGGYTSSQPTHSGPRLIPAPFVNETKCRVLVIDDCPDMLRLLKVYLTEPGIRVTSAHNGLEGVAAFKDGIFDLVLIDMEMPVMNGYAATMSIRAWESEHRSQRTPIAALTVVSDLEASHRMLLAGCNLHLTKPVARTTLLQIVGQLGSVTHPAQ